MFNQFPTFNSMNHTWVPSQFKSVEWDFVTDNPSSGFRVHSFDHVKEDDLMTIPRIERQDLISNRNKKSGRRKLITDAGEVVRNIQEDYNVNYPNPFNFLNTHLNPAISDFNGTNKENVINPELKLPSKIIREKIINPINRDREPIKERFESNNESSTIKEHEYTYLRMLETRAMAVAEFLNKNKNYSKFKKNWELLKRNLNRNGITFKQLEKFDGDIAYVMDKGDEINFRLRDKHKFMPINIYQYVLYHEMGHMSTDELQHTETFYKLMSVIVLAAFELGFIDIRRQSDRVFETNGQQIVNKQGVKDEIISGAKLIMTEETAQYYRSLINFIDRL